jgi:hypothetical protein
MPTPTRLCALAMITLLPLAAVTQRKRSLTRAAYALLSWHVQAAGLVRGLLRPRRCPQQPIASRILREPDEAPRPRPDAADDAPARPQPPSAQAT